MCDCDRCQYSREVKKMLDGLEPEKRKFFEIMYEGLLNTQSDLDYQNAIMDGSWPNAIPILQNALIRARNHRAVSDLPDENRPAC